MLVQGLSQRGESRMAYHWVQQLLTLLAMEYFEPCVLGAPMANWMMKQADSQQNARRGLLRGGHEECFYAAD